MPVPMSKEEIEFTINGMREKNNATHDAHYDRVIARMCNYLEANIDDFMAYYDEVDADCELHDTDSLSDIMGGGQG